MNVKAGLALAVVSLALPLCSPSIADAVRTSRFVPRPESRPDPPAVFTRLCTRCHPADRIVDGRRLASQWTEVLDKMADKMAAEGKPISDDDYAVVEAFLLSEYGRVNVNTDGADLLETVLGLSAKDAKAIVSYRTSHGAFADFDALLSMPGAPVAVLKEKRAAVQF